HPPDGPGEPPPICTSVLVTTHGYDQPCVRPRVCPGSWGCASPPRGRDREVDTMALIGNRIACGVLAVTTGLVLAACGMPRNTASGASGTQLAATTPSTLATPSTPATADSGSATGGSTAAVAGGAVTASTWARP